MVTIKQKCAETYEERVLFGEMNTMGSTLEQDGQEPEQPCMVYLREGTYPIFVPNVSGESDASSKYSYYVPKSIVVTAANQLRDTNYKRWAEDVVAKNNVHKVIFRRKWVVEEINQKAKEGCEEMVIFKNIYVVVKELIKEIN